MGNPICFRCFCVSPLDPGPDSNLIRSFLDIVFNKLVLTTLKYTPLVLTHHAPATALSTPGKYKIATNSKQYATCQRLIKSYFHSLNALVNSVGSASGIVEAAVRESERLVPWLVGNKKVSRGWMKVSVVLSLYCYYTTWDVE